MKILGLSAGSHSCGISLIENGKVIFSLEEERHTRVKVYKDFYSNYFNIFNVSFNKYFYLVIRKTQNS